MRLMRQKETEPEGIRDAACSTPQRYKEYRERRRRYF